MMRVDLAAARSAWLKEARDEEEKSQRERSDFLTYQDKNGLFADFHANRHTFISNLGRAGVSLTTAQKLARHSDPKLTANTYTHVQVSHRAAAVQSLPPLQVWPLAQPPPMRPCCGRRIQTTAILKTAGRLNCQLACAIRGARNGAT